MGGIHHIKIDTHHLFPRISEAVKGAGFYKRLHGLFIDTAVHGTLRKILEIPVRAVFLPLCDDIIDDVDTHSLYGCQGVSDIASRYGKSHIALVDIRGQDLDAHGLAGCDIS